MSDGRAPSEAPRFKALIAGGGVAGLEAALALRHLAGDRIAIELLAPQAEFVHRPVAVAEPFGLGQAARVPMERVTRDLGLTLTRAALAGLEPQRRVALTSGGEERSYDALLLALGAESEEALPGAITYAGPQANEAIRELLEEIERGEVSELVFALPSEARWGLPLYELAALTAKHQRRHRHRARLTVTTHEHTPLAMFGGRVSRSVASLLEEVGVGLRTSSNPTAVKPGSVLLSEGEVVPADRVVAMSSLRVPRIPGVPQGWHGFIGTDRFMRAEGLAHVVAAGDVTWFPIKQGGLAAQQADVAAATIAAWLDDKSPTETFNPVLRGALLTGGAPLYLRSEIGDREGSSAAGRSSLWWPPSKVAGRHLAPYLLHRYGDGHARPALEDLEPLEDEDPEEAGADQSEALELALAAAEADARWRDYRGAVRWLEIAEEINLALPPEYEERRRRWSRAAASAGAAARDQPVSR